MNLLTLGIILGVLVLVVVMLLAMYVKAPTDEAFNTSRGYIKEGVKPKDVMSYKDFMESMQSEFERFVKDKPQLDEDNVYIELYEGEDYDSEVVFTWLEPESDAAYRRRCEEINRLNEVKIAAERMEFERKIKENPELVKEILKELGMVVVFND